MTEELTHSSISDFIRQWVKEMMRGEGYETLDELVAQGYCADLATVLWQYFDAPDAVVFHSSDDPCHTWIEFQGKHYDMQNPGGVIDPGRLLYFQNANAS